MLNRVYENSGNRGEDKGQFYYFLGDAYLGLGQHREAFHAFEKALNLDPKMKSKALLKQGQIFEHAGMISNAISAYRMGLDDLSISNSPVYNEAQKRLRDLEQKRK